MLLSDETLELSLLIGFLLDVTTVAGQLCKEFKLHILVLHVQFVGNVCGAIVTVCFVSTHCI